MQEDDQIYYVYESLPSLENKDSHQNITRVLSWAPTYSVNMKSDLVELMHLSENYSFNTERVKGKEDTWLFGKCQVEFCKFCTVIEHIFLEGNKAVGRTNWQFENQHLGREGAKTCES